MKLVTGLRLLSAALAVTLLMTTWNHRLITLAFVATVAAWVFLDLRRDRIIAVTLVIAAALPFSIQPASAMDGPTGGNGFDSQGSMSGDYARDPGSNFDAGRFGERVLEIARDLALGGAALGNKSAGMAAAALELLREAMGGGNGGAHGDSSTGDKK